MTVTQGLLMPGAIVGMEEVSLAEANGMIDAWGHYLGPVHRPFGSQCWALCVEGEPIAAAVSCSIVSDHITEQISDPESGKKIPGRSWLRGEVVELARLCARERWATRPMLRLWREVAAPRWPYWTPTAAVAYSASRRHEGDLYRWDGWSLMADVGDANGRGQWSKKRPEEHPARGPKRLWVWEYPMACVDPPM